MLLFDDVEPPHFPNPTKSSRWWMSSITRNRRYSEVNLGSRRILTRNLAWKKKSKHTQRDAGEVNDPKHISGIFPSK